MVYKTQSRDYDSSKVFRLRLHLIVIILNYMYQFVTL